MSRLLGHLTKQKRQKRKDVRAVKSSVSDASGAMDSSEQTVLSSAVSMSTATKWHRPADCSTREPRPLETRSLRLLTGASQARRVCSLMPSEDTSGRRGLPHTGGRWRGTTEPGHWGSGRRELPVCSQSADSSSASAAQVSRPLPLPCEDIVLVVSWLFH